jgi:hypothetical protein
MLPRKSQRRLKPITIYEEKKALSIASDLKLGSETARNKPEIALKSITVELLLVVNSRQLL